MEMEYIELLKLRGLNGTSELRGHHIRKVIQMSNQQSKKCCDTCKYYHWYYDKCDKYDCEVDARSVCAAYEPYKKGGKESE